MRPPPHTVTGTEGIVFTFSPSSQMVNAPHFSLYIFDTSDVRYLFHMFNWSFCFFVNYPDIFYCYWPAAGLTRIRGQ